MKKILLGTTAVVALGTMTTEAFAADKIALGLGGFMRHYVGLSKHDEVAATAGAAAVARAKDIGQFTNTEIYFTGDTTLDNGIKVAARIELEADQDSTNQVDRGFLTISSDAMGSVVIGTAPHFGDDNAVRVPNVGNFDWSDTAEKWSSAQSAAGTSSAAWAPTAGTLDNWGGDSAKLKYTSPNFGGVTVGMSYSAAEGDNGSNARLVTGTAQDGYTFGAAYSGDMGGAAISASVTHANIDTNFEQTAGGLTVGMAGFTVGGGYTDFNDTRATAQILADANGSTEGNAWELGVSYETGPYAVSAGYMVAKNDGVIATVGENKDTRWNVAATYDMGAGVVLMADYYHAKNDKEGTGTAANAARSVSGVIAGIEVGF